MGKQILALLLCIANYCQAQSSVSIVFDIDLEHSKEINIETFRFYASNFQIEYSDGTFDKTISGNQLIDIEEEKSGRISIPVQANKSIQAIHYLIGTDSLANVSGAMDGDLDPLKGMYWAWNSGYINFKLEGSRMMSGKKIPFEYHIGGYNGTQATSRMKTIDVSQLENTDVIIKVKPYTFIRAAELINEFSIMIPGKKAVQLANFLPSIFSLE